MSTTASGEGRRWFGKRRSSPEPTPVDITERLSILDLRDPARAGTGAASGVSGRSAEVAGDDATPAPWAWKPTIYVPPGPGPDAAVEATVTAPSEPATVEPEPAASWQPAAPAQPQPQSTHFSDAARYEAAAFELPSAGSAATPAQAETWSHQVAPAPVAQATAAETPAPPAGTPGEVEHTHAESMQPEPTLDPRPDVVAAPLAEPTYLEPTPLEPVAAEPVESQPAPVETFATSGWRDDDAARPVATTTEPSYEPAPVEVHVARIEDQHTTYDDLVVDLTGPAVGLPEQSSDLTEAAPEPVLASVVEPAWERSATEPRPVEEDDVIRWTW